MDEYTEENYKTLKRRLQAVMEINMAMTADYERAKKKIKMLSYERNILLDNIARTESVSDDSSSTASGGSQLHSDGSDTESEDDMGMAPIQRHNPSFLALPKKPRVKRQRVTPENDLITVASAPPKRSRFSNVNLKTRRVQPVECDEDGRPKLPLEIGVLTVRDLGKIVNDRETFHTKRYIFPVGYTVSRTYPSMIDPKAMTVVTSTILDGGDGPRFQVVADDMPDEPIIASSATGAWTMVVRRSNEIRNRDHSNSASGPEYYGFKHPTIAKMIQDLPGADQLQHYVWQPFEEMEPGAAKGVMAAAQKKRGNLEQMGNANRRQPKDDSSTLMDIDDAKKKAKSASSTLHHLADSQPFHQPPASTLPSISTSSTTQSFTSPTTSVQLDDSVPIPAPKLEPTPTLAPLSSLSYPTETLPPAPENHLH